MVFFSKIVPVYPIVFYRTLWSLVTLSDLNVMSTALKLSMVKNLQL